MDSIIWKRLGGILKKGFFPLMRLRGKEEYRLLEDAYEMGLPNSVAGWL